MRFWTSDLHLSHARILELCPERPWPDVQAMNRGLIERWNACVRPEDEVWDFLPVPETVLGPILAAL